MSQASLREILGSDDDTALPGLLDLVSSPIFDDLAKLGSQVSGRSEFLICLNLREAGLILGSNVETYRFIPMSAMPSQINLPYFEAFDGACDPEIEQTSLKTGREIAAVTIARMTHGAEVIGFVCAYEPKEKGLLAPAQKSSFLKIVRLASHLIEMRSAVHLLVRDAQAVLGD